MKPALLTTISAGLLFTAAAASAATLSHRYSFNEDTTDSVGGNTGILRNGATVTATSLSVSGSGSGGANGGTSPNMGFSSAIGIGANYGSTGVTVETWYTDAGTGTWGKLFTFGTSVGGQEFAFTNEWGGNGSAVDRNGTTGSLFGFRAAVGTEHHLVISVAAAGNLNAWLDGTQVVTNDPTNPLSNVGTQVEAIGATAWGDPGHFGEVNEFRIWSGELTGAEVAQNRALGPNSLVPEPTGAALLGLGTLLTLRRRRRA